MSQSVSYKIAGVAYAVSVIFMIVLAAREFRETRYKAAAGERRGRSEDAEHVLTPKAPVLDEKPIDSVRNATELPAASYTCESNTSAAFDSVGNPCVSLDKLAQTQLVRVATTKDVSYIYCGIPKNGCTFHFGVMQRLIGANQNYEHPGNVHRSSTMDQLRVSPEKLARMMLNPRIEKYMVVRNPLQRALSAYLDKVERYLPARNRTPQAFEDWVYEEFKPDKEPRVMNPHWRPQVYFCGFNMRDFWRRFRLFRVEKPAEFVDFLEELLPKWLTKQGWNGDDDTSLRQAVLGPRKRTGNTNERFFEFVSNLELYDYLAEVYEADIRGLGYQQEVSDLREELARRIEEGKTSGADPELGKL